VGKKHTSGLDVTYAVLANDHVAPDLAFKNKDFPYFHNLLAARKMVDSLPNEMWEQSICILIVFASAQLW
jgi:hypothetical protein